MGDSFIAGEIPVYEKYSFWKKRTMFGLIKILFVFTKIFSDSEAARFVEKKDSWYKVHTDVRIHKKRLIIITQKRLLIMWWFLKYGKNVEEIYIKDVRSIQLDKNGSPTLCISCNAKTICIPVGKGTKMQDVQHFVKNIRVVNPKIDVLGF